MGRYRNPFVTNVFLILFFLFFGLPVLLILLGIILSFFEWYIILAAFLAIVGFASTNYYNKIKPYSKYLIGDKQLIIDPDSKKIIIPYFDVINIYLDNLNNRIIIESNIYYKYNNINPEKYSKAKREYKIDGDGAIIKNDYESLLGLCRLKEKMNKSDESFRRKMIQELFNEGSLEDFFKK